MDEEGKARERKWLKLPLSIYLRRHQTSQIAQTISPTERTMYVFGAKASYGREQCSFDYKENEKTEEEE